MTHKNTGILAVIFAAIAVVLGGAAVLKGGLYIGKHEGDTLHLMQIVFRMLDGQVPHLDFMTPIGALAFWPVVLMVQAGFGIGMAVLLSQIVVAALFVPVLIWVARSRLTFSLGLLFGAIILVLLLALVHGEAQRSVSISMHYNRLAWAAAFVAILMAVVPPVRGGTAMGDGLILGVMACALAMIKMTYFIAFAGPILLALIMTGQLRALAVAVATGIAVFLAITLAVGPDYWLAYAGDLLAVAGSDGRAAPGEPLSAIAAAPAYLGGTLVLLAGVVALRQTGVATGGLILLLLMPGFIYVTYQNFGNDPQWLLLLAVLLLALRPQAQQVVNGFGWDLKQGLGLLAALALALEAPSFFNLAYSPFRHLAVDPVEYQPMLPGPSVHQDLMAMDLRVDRIDARIALDGERAGLPAYADRTSPPQIMGETLPVCAVELGLPGFMAAIARDLDAAGLAQGRGMLVADVFSGYWLFAPLRPLRHGAPWYYGGLPGLADADYVMVPICPVVQSGQVQILGLLDDAVTAGQLDLTEIRRTELYILFSVDRFAP